MVAEKTLMGVSGRQSSEACRPRLLRLNAPFDHVDSMTPRGANDVGFSDLMHRPMTSNS